MGKPTGAPPLEASEVTEVLWFWQGRRQDGSETLLGLNSWDLTCLDFTACMAKAWAAVYTAFGQLELSAWLRIVFFSRKEQGWGLRTWLMSPDLLASCGTDVSTSTDCVQRQAEKTPVQAAAVLLASVDSFPGKSLEAGYVFQQVDCKTGTESGEHRWIRAHRACHPKSLNPFPLELVKLSNQIHLHLHGFEKAFSRLKPTGRGDNMQEMLSCLSWRVHKLRCKHQALQAASYTDGDAIPLAFFIHPQALLCTASGRKSAPPGGSAWLPVASFEGGIKYASLANALFRYFAPFARRTLYLTVPKHRRNQIAGS